MTPDIADIIAGELKVSRGTAYDMMREALKEAQPVEPVAWVTGFHAGRCVIQTTNPAAILPVGIALYTAPQPVPVKTYHDFEPLPVAPVPNGPFSAPIKVLWPVAPKPWVDLTDEEIMAAPENLIACIAYVRNKLREKNGGAA
jgi:hypothetical protein